MSLDPNNPQLLTAGDLCKQALKEARVIGVGQDPLAEDLSDALWRLTTMLQQWERKRWLVYHLVTLSKTSTGALFYSVGPGGDLDTGTKSTRPAKLESAFLRQLVNSQPNQIDYEMEILQSREDYNRIALKALQSFPMYAFLDTGWPLASLYFWPVPQSAIYSLNISILEQLPQSFATAATAFNIPFEYYNAMLFNLAIRLYPKYGKIITPGDPVVELAKDALNVIRTANVQIAALQMPKDMQRAGIYNIFSDRTY